MWTMLDFLERVQLRREQMSREKHLAALQYHDEQLEQLKVFLADCPRIITPEPPPAPVADKRDAATYVVADLPRHDESACRREEARQRVRAEATQRERDRASAALRAKGLGYLLNGDVS